MDLLTRHKRPWNGIWCYFRTGLTHSLLYIMPNRPSERIRIFCKNPPFKDSLRWSTEREKLPFLWRLSKWEWLRLVWAGGWYERGCLRLQQALFPFCSALFPLHSPSSHLLYHPSHPLQAGSSLAPPQNIRKSTASNSHTWRVASLGSVSRKLMIKPGYCCCEKVSINIVE